MLGWIFSEKKLLQLLHKKKGTKLTKDNLSFSFYDLEGNGYYSFPKEVKLPIERIGRLNDYYTLLSAGLSGSEIERNMDAIDKAITGMLTGDKKGLAKVGFIVSDMRERKGLVLHPELYYNILAIQIIRHDEKVNEFNNDIHMQKVEAFKRLDSENDVFFLATQPLLEDLGFQNITREVLQNLLRESDLRIRAMAEMIQKI